jgi:hypothetical protein
MLRLWHVLLMLFPLCNWVSTQAIPYITQDLTPGTRSFVPDRIIPLKDLSDPRMLAFKDEAAYLIRYSSIGQIWTVDLYPFPYTILPGPTNKDERKAIARDDDGT